MLNRSLALLAVLGVQLAGAATVEAQAGYPSRSVRILAGVGPGGAPDVVARLAGQWLSERLGQTFLVENRPGAGGNLAVDNVVRAEPDGHTLLIIAPSAAINATLYEKLTFNFMRDIAPVAALLKSPEVLLVHPALPAKTLSDLIDHGKANPGKLNMASAGTGSGPHLSGVLLMMMSGASFTHVPYRSGAQALTDVIAGRVELTFVASGFGAEHVRAGTLRPLGVTTDARSVLMPEVPAIGEILPGYESGTWFGLGAPRDTPVAIIDRLNKEINAILADPKVKIRIAELDGVPMPGPPSAFAKLIADETAKKRKIIQTAGIKPE